MFTRYDITHTTRYLYSKPVTFGEHRVMFRPRDSHDLRVLATDLEVSPHAAVRLIQDPHSNSVALVQPLAPATELRIVCRFRIEHAQSHNLELPLSPSAELYPFAYGVEERFDLEHYLRPHYDDPQGELTRWARQFLRTDGPTGTREMLVHMNQFIRDHFEYGQRDEEGTQTPLQTLALGSGTCRDFALLMMEAARRLGIATRFVSGYLYDPALDDALVAARAARPPSDTPADPPAEDAAAAATPTVGAGSTHAWLQAYLPGAGWVPFDPTNNLLGGNQLIRVGVARDPSQAAPVTGSWYGDPEAYEGMEVRVNVRRVLPPVR
ncbi:transglutaminase family protein [Aquincola tertiaricarbonis]|uniref:Transglutaminase family protein n=1 Tax=Aquincola tertiaricarbonis TaxID=391953 RepID=A0ABY4SC08_AQUTE|nr:transglutaminase family protein [Aquincola tertiaricarbonis]URI10528.1 transglutaminase family protein [Aquincola tertiaricarbonis]